MDLNSDPNIRSSLCTKVSTPRNPEKGEQAHSFGGNAGAAAARLICRNTNTARVEVGGRGMHA